MIMGIFKDILDEIETIKNDKVSELNRRLKAVDTMCDSTGKFLPEAKEEAMKVITEVIEANNDLVTQTNKLMYYTGKLVLNILEENKELKAESRQYKQYLKAKQLSKDFRDFKKATGKPRSRALPINEVT
jgi:hypothetical protein